MSNCKSGANYLRVSRVHCLLECGFVDVVTGIDDTGREDLTQQCQLEREAGNVAVHPPVVITADKNATDAKSTQKDDSDGMSYLDDEVLGLLLPVVMRQ